MLELQDVAYSKVSRSEVQILLNQARAWFLEIAFVRKVGMYVCVCVCPPPRP